MSVLMRSVSGIRGIVGPGFSPCLVAEYVNAFVQLTGAKKVVIGRDTRPTGVMVENIVAGACAAAGAEPVLTGISSTPTVELLVEKLHAGGGIIITASHNPIEWNALKFLTSEGIFLDENEVQQLFELVDQRRFVWKDYSQVKPVQVFLGGDEHHIEKILALPLLDVARIRARRFKVAYDGVNGAGSLIVPKLLQALGCEMKAIYTEPSGIFPRNPEPTSENLRELEDLVLQEKCDVGFSTDPDADRLALVTDKGRAIGEEYTLALATLLILSRKPGPVTVNLSTSRMVEDIAEGYGVPVERTKVGEVNVAVAMKRNGSVIGGEGNGGVMLPDLHLGRDGILAIALILELMAERTESLSAIAAEIVPYHIEKTKLTLGSQPLQNIYARLEKKIPGAKIDYQDGMRLAFEKSWVHVRPSNTEPVVRVIAEAPDRAQAEELCRLIRVELES